jgi:hypothetical protein
MQRLSSLALALVAILAISATAAGAASAAPTLELLSALGALKTGDEMTMVVAATVTVETNDGDVTCVGEEGLKGIRLPGTDVTNNEKTDKIELGESALFQTGTCLTGFSFLGASAEPDWFAVSASTLGTVSLSTNGKAELNAQGEDAFFLHFSDDEPCEYRYTKLKGTFAPATDALNNVQPAFVKQKLSDDPSASSPRCPTKATLTFSIYYALTKTNAAVDDRLSP